MWKIVFNKRIFRPSPLAGAPTFALACKLHRSYRTLRDVGICLRCKYAWAFTPRWGLDLCPCQRIKSIPVHGKIWVLILDDYMQRPPSTARAPNEALACDLHINYSPLNKNAVGSHGRHSNLEGYNYMRSKCKEFIFNEKRGYICFYCTCC